MITFLDENDVEYGALATIKATNAVNGERSLTGTIVSGDYVLSNIERGWRLRFDDEYYVVTYAKPIDEGRYVQVTFDAVHQFFWDFDKSSVYDQLPDGSHTFAAYLDFIFKKSGYSYTVDSALNVHAFEKQSFGLKKRLALFNDIITSTGVEFQVNGKVVRILEKVGTDLSTIVRKNFNMNELTIEKNIGDFVTYQKGYGAYFDEENHSKGRLVAEYTSPLASVYGKLEAEPFVDERYKQSSSLLSVLKENVDNSYTISVSLDMEDLTRAGYKYKQPVAGDYIMAINETLDFQEKIRIVSFASEYDVQGILVKHEVTCNDIGTVKKLSASYNLTKKQASSASATASNAYSIANKALVSADGKNTNYYTNSFPIDNPKGTLKTGDLLFLTVGDTVKQYYWNGADWVINPVIDDVEAFKEQIADELKDVPNREEFENKISEELANSKAEIETQIETAKTQAESNAKAYADEINQATTEVAEQANTAANSLKSDLSKVKADLTATTTIANAAKTSVSEAKQQLATVADDLSKAKTDLQNAVSEVDTKATNLQSDLTKAKQDLTSQASQLTAQASAQSELTKRVSSVEETANGTKTTVSELSKTVEQNGKGITSVTARTKTVEDNLTSTKTTLSQVQTTANSTSKKAATLETGLNGLSAKFENLSVGTTNHFLDSAFETTIQKIGIFQNGNVYTPSIDTTEKYYGYNTLKIVCKDSAGVDNPKITYPALAKLKAVQQGKLPDVVTISFWGKSNTEGMILYTRLGFTNYESSQNVTLTTGWKRYIVHVKTSNAATNEWLFKLSKAGTVWIAKPQFEFSAIASDYHTAEEDTSSKVAEYKQTADQNYASLQTTVQNLDGTVTANKAIADQTAQGFTMRIESLETYKDGEDTRANQYFESAKTETARQLTAERTAIAKDYVAKSTYTSDVTGIRNDLSATTTTANTTKTNLANYQANNDKAVANLQSNLQTANGNISSLKTKVEAVPGQITSAVSAVEGKIPTSISQRNLAQRTSDVWSPFVDITAKNNWKYDLATLKYGENTGIYAGTTINIFVYLSADNIVLDSSINPRFSIQGAVVDKNGIETWTGWDKYNPVYNKWSTNLKAGNNYEIVKISAKVSSESYANIDGFKIGVRIDGARSGKFRHRALMVTTGDVFPDNWQPAPEDTIDQISSLSSQIKQTADGMTLLATKTELNTAKSDLQSDIATATSKAETAQSTANNNVQTISTHTAQISALNTGLSAKVSQTDFNVLSGRVTTAENNITAKANELSSKITSVESKIPTKTGLRNYVLGTSTAKISNGGKLYDLSSAFDDIADDATLIVEFDWSVTAPTSTSKFRINRVITYSDGTADQWNNAIYKGGLSSDVSTSSGSGHYSGVFTKGVYKSTAVSSRYLNLNQTTTSGTVTISNLSIRVGSLKGDWQPAPEDYDSKLASAQSEIKQTTDAITASVSSLDSSTVKSSSLTINTDGIVMKAGKSTTDVANAIGSYFAVNQNAINLFSDKINVKGSMIVDGAITSTKIASKSINTAHLNGKIITADVIATGAITADAIKAGAITTDKMTANSINGDRITAGTLDAAKIKASSITASQIASGTITSNQIKAGGISAANIATGAITADKIAAGAINADKIAANAITADKIKAGSITADMFKGNQITSLNGATTLNLHTGEIIFNNQYATINQTKGSYKSQISLFSLDNGAVTEGAWSSVNTLAFNNTKLTSATRRAGSTVDMFPTFSLMTLYGERIAFTGEKSGSPGSNNAIIITTKPEEVNFTNGLTNNSKGKWNYSMIMDFGTKAVINVPDIKLDGHLKSLTGILDDLCKKAGIMWI